MKMPLRKFTDEEETEIGKIYQAQGHSMRAIADAYRCAPNTIRYLLRKRLQIEKNSIYLRRNLYHLAYRAFDNLNMEAPVYWLGFLFADGHLTKDKRTIALRLSSKDETHVQQFRTFLQCDYPLYNTCRVSKGIQYGSVALYATHAHLGKRLAELGMASKSIITATKYIPRELIHHFVRGLFDGDGCARKGRPEIIFCGPKPTMVWLRDILVINADTNPTLSIIEHQSGSVHYLYYGGRLQVTRIASWLYHDATVWLARKREILDSYQC